MNHSRFKIPDFRFVAFVALWICASVVTARAQTVNAASCNASDILSAWATVTSSTTVFNIPTTGSPCSWTSQVALTVPSGNTNLTFQAQTTCSGSGAPASNNLACVDNTVIVDNYNSSNTLLSITLNSNPAASFRLTGLTVQGGSGTTKYGDINIYGPSQNVRIDHNHFNPATYSPAIGMVMVRLYGTAAGPMYGVWDHNLSDGTATPYQEAINVYNGDSPNGDAVWAAATSFGGPNFFFVENSTFNSFGAVNDCFVGGRLVFRYNTVNHSNVQTHPTGGAGDWRGCRAMEVYGNAGVESNSTPEYNFFFLSSGPGLFWGNSLPTGYKSAITGHSMRRNATPYPQTATPGGWGYCGTSFNGVGSAWDQNSNASTGYRCLDQPGQGQGQLLNGQFPSKKNTVTGTIASPNEAQEGFYEWADPWAAPPGYGPFFLNTDSSALVNNSDYYLFCDPTSTTGCTSFNGTAGVGQGTLVPTNASAYTNAPNCNTVVGYWDITSQTFYKCLTTNTWTAVYSPYSYPYPGTGTTLASPTASPAGGTFTSSQSVSLTLPSGSTGCYTTNGSTPAASTSGTCSNGTTYSGAISVGSSLTLQAIATEIGFVNSGVGSWSFTITPILPTPSASPAGGSFTSSQSVTLTLAAGATGCYTTDGSTPAATTAGTCSHGTTYSGAITVASSLTLKAIATETAYTNSGVGSWAFTITTTLATPTASPAGGTFAGSQSVTLTLPGGSTGCYTTDGSTPDAASAGTCSHGSTYSGAITVSASLTLQAISTESGFLNSTVGSWPFTIITTLPTPSASPAGGSFTSSQTVTLTLAAGATGCYTTDGSTPAASTPGTCSHGSTYSSSITVVSSLTLQALATESGFINSGVGSWGFTITTILATPTASPSGGTFTSSQSVTLTLPGGSTGCYTRDGSTPTAITTGTCSHGTTYSGAITVSASETLQAISTEVGFLNSAVGSWPFTITASLPTPTATPGGGTFSTSQSVALGLSSGSTGCYTVDGSTPAATTPGTCSHGSTYSGAITVGSSLTLRAIATQTGFSNSVAGSWTFTITGLTPPTNLVAMPH